MSDTPEKEDDLLDLDQLDNEIADSGEDADDFLADLNDILDDDGGAESSGDEADLEDLDSLFDDFDEEAAGADAEAAEAADDGLESLDDLLDLDAEDEGAAEAGGDDLLDLDDDELDLSGGDDADEPEVEEPLEEVAVAAAAAAVAGAAATAAAQPAETPRAATAAAPAQPSQSGRLPLVALLVSVPALLIGAAGLFIGLSQGGQVAELEQRLAESRPAPAAAPALDPRLGPALDEIEALQARVGELALLIEGPMSHLSESNETALATINERLAKLEEGLKAPAPAAVAPVARKAETVSKPVETKPVETKPAGGWVVNLISVSSQKQADVEYARLKRMGYDAAITRAKVGGQTWYRLQIPGFADYQEAKAYADKARKQGLSNAWVTKG